MRLIGLALLLVAPVLASCVLPPAPGGELTFDQLWRRAGQLDGQQVTVTGYYFGGFETSALLAGPESNKPGEPRCWVSGRQPMFGASNMAQPVEGWVRLTGAFHRQEGQRYGHLGGYDCEVDAASVEELSQEP